MGKVQAKKAGTCCKCKKSFNVGDTIGVEKGKPPVCSACAPATTEVKAKVWQPAVASVLTAWDYYALEVIKSPFVTKDGNGQNIVALATEVADAMMVKRNERGL